MMTLEPKSPAAPLEGLRSGSESGGRSNLAPGEAVIFFDGVCGLCNAWIDFVIARDGRRVFRYGALQGETARNWLNLPPDASFDSVMLADNSGVYRKSAAVWRILIKLPGPWPIVGFMLRIVPRPLRDWGYDFVARRRYQWFGKKETCRIPTAEERARFLP